MESFFKGIAKATSALKTGLELENLKDERTELKKELETTEAELIELKKSTPASLHLTSVKDQISKWKTTLFPELQAVTELGELSTSAQSSLTALCDAMERISTKNTADIATTEEKVETLNKRIDAINKRLNVLRGKKENDPTTPPPSAPAAVPVVEVKTAV